MLLHADPILLQNLLHFYGRGSIDLGGMDASMW